MVTRTWCLPRGPHTSGDWYKKEIIDPEFLLNIKGPDGTGKSTAWSRPSFGTKPKIRRNTSDEKTIKILQILQKVHTTPELFLFNFYGKEGEHRH